MESVTKVKTSTSNLKVRYTLWLSIKENPDTKREKERLYCISYILKVLKLKLKLNCFSCIRPQSTCLYP